MKKIIALGIGLFSVVGAFLLSFGPAKANVNYLGNDWGYNNSINDINFRYRNPFDYNFMKYRNIYSPNRFYNDFYSRVTYPRTVYLVDAGNSANQLNIINNTTGGSTTAARIIVPTWAYNRIVNDYNQLGVVSVRVDTSRDLVTFQTVNGTYTVPALSVDFQ